MIGEIAWTRPAAGHHGSTRWMNGKHGGHGPGDFTPDNRPYGQVAGRLRWERGERTVIHFLPNCATNHIRIASIYIVGGSKFKDVDMNGEGDGRRMRELHAFWKSLHISTTPDTVVSFFTTNP